MSVRLQSLVARREALVRRSDVQRERLAAHAAGLRGGLWFVEAAPLGVRFATSRPLLFVPGAGTILVPGPRRLLDRGGTDAVGVLLGWRLGGVGARP